jgi:hypothetical protein
MICRDGTMTQLGDRPYKTRAHVAFFLFGPSAPAAGRITEVTRPAARRRPQSERSALAGKTIWARIK